MVEPNGKNENITSGSTHTGIEICDADIDLAQIFPASAIKSLLRNEDGLGAEGARVYSDAADLLSASSAMFLHDLASSAIEVAKKENSNTTIIGLDHLKKCIQQQKRKFDCVAEVGSLINDEQQQSKKKSLRTTYSNIISRQNYKPKKKDREINTNGEDDPNLLFRSTKQTTKNTLEYYANELHPNSPSSIVHNDNTTIVEDDDDYD